MCFSLLSYSSIYGAAEVCKFCKAALSHRHAILRVFCFASVDAVTVKNGAFASLLPMVSMRMRMVLWYFGIFCIIATSGKHVPPLRVVDMYPC